MLGGRRVDLARLAATPRDRRRFSQPGPVVADRVSESLLPVGVAVAFRECLALERFEVVGQSVVAVSLGPVSGLFADLEVGRQRGGRCARAPRLRGYTPFLSYSLPFLSYSLPFLDIGRFPVASPLLPRCFNVIYLIIIDKIRFYWSGQRAFSIGFFALSLIHI